MIERSEVANPNTSDFSTNSDGEIKKKSYSNCGAFRQVPHVPRNRGPYLVAEDFFARHNFYKMKRGTGRYFLARTPDTIDMPLGGREGGRGSLTGPQDTWNRPTLS